MKFTPTTKFIYNEETRVHTLGKSIIPSVTQVIAPLCDYSRVPTQTLNHKRDLGIAFHEAINLYLHGDLDENSIDPQLAKPMEAFRVWWKKEKYSKNYKNEELIIETPAYHHKLKFCGKPDLVIVDTVYDWKLRPYNPVADTLQMAAYMEMVARLYAVVVCFDLYGNYKTHHVFNTNAWPVFRKLLDKWKVDQKFNSLIEQWKESAK